jgi:signal transduction histidine kinase
LLFEGSQMEQLLVNLLDNACKFTPTAGLIEIKGYPFFWERRTQQAAEFNLSTDRRIQRMQAPNCFRVDIQDSGPGISPVHLGKIFEEYTSYGGGNDRSGGGLGLAICKMIACQHHGKVWAENTPAGPVFSFVLPFRRTENRIPVGTEGFESRSRAVS